MRVKNSKAIEDLNAFFNERLPSEKKEAYLSILKNSKTLREQKKLEENMMKAKHFYAGNEEQIHFGDESLIAFLEKFMDFAEGESIKAHLRTCSPCFKRMTELKRSIREAGAKQFRPTPNPLIEQAKRLQPTPSALRDKAKEVYEVRPHTFFNPVRRLLNKVETWFDFRIGWAYSTVTVLAVTGILIILLWPSHRVQNISLGSQLVISEMGPLGFIDRTEVREYKGMLVRLSKDERNIVFEWPEIEMAALFEIHLIRDQMEAKRITPFVGISNTDFSYPTQNMVHDVKFTWELSGKLTDGRVFRAKSQFVLN